MWTLAVTFTPIAANFQPGDEVSAAVFNTLFAAIENNFIAAKDAIDQLEAQVGILALPFEGTVAQPANTAAFEIVGTGDETVAHFESDNPLGSSVAVKAIADGQQNGLALQASNFGLGGAAFFDVTSGSNTQPAVEISTLGSGPALKARAQGSGLAGEFAGDVAQGLADNGLVKAAATAYCNNTGSQVNPNFNTLGSAVSVANGGATGRCRIDFDFDLSNRYWTFTPLVGLGVDAANAVMCFLDTAVNDVLECQMTDSGGTNQDGTVMVLVY